MIIAFDLLGGTGAKALDVTTAGDTLLIASSSETPTGSMVGHPEIDHPDLASLQSHIDNAASSEQRAASSERNLYVDAARIATQLLDSSATGNIFLLGVAIQAGAVPVDPALMKHAIELNGVAVEVNFAAFRYGRS